jgi:hypothetical protein
MNTKNRSSVTTPPKRQRGHTSPKAPLIGLDQTGRLRLANCLAILSIHHSTFCRGVRSGRYPPPDGRDGKFPYWNTKTIASFLGEQPSND